MFARAHIAIPGYVGFASKQNSGAGTIVVISKPTGTAQNDVMLSFVGCQSGAVLWSGDSGWTELIDQGAAPDLRIARLTAGGSEPSSYTFTADTAAGTKGGAVLSFRAAAYDTIGSLSPSATTCVAPAITVAKDGSVLLAIFMMAAPSGSFSIPTGMRLLASDSDGDSPSWAVFYQDAQAGSTGTRTSTLSSAGFGVLVSLSPA